MLDRLAQLIVDRLEPKIDRMIQAQLDDLRVEVIDGVAGAAGVISAALDQRLIQDIEVAKQGLKKQITEEILKGVKL